MTDRNYLQAIERFKRLLKQMARTKTPEPTAVVLSTADLQGCPSIRTVLLKGVDEQGFVFYTNLKSRKAKQIRSNPRAALCFYWEPLRRQVLVEGRVVPVSKKEADAYWAIRPRESQIGAWASEQSSPLKSRAVLLVRAARLARQFVGKPIPRPLFWSGFCVVPDRIEFWQRGPFRLHKRELYVKEKNRWTKTLLYP